MKGYIYTMFAGADPANGWEMTDPIFGDPPTLGACMPNIRRAVAPGDFVFAISGRTTGVRQYVVGGFQVDRKIRAIEAYHQFPQYRMCKDSGVPVRGNIIVDANGNHLPQDYHDNFERRVENYIVGRDPIALSSTVEVERARTETIPVLNEVFQRAGNSVHEVIGRWRRMDGTQIDQLLTWMSRVKLQGNP